MCYTQGVVVGHASSAAQITYLIALAPRRRAALGTKRNFSNKIEMRLEDRGEVQQEI